MNSTKSGKLNKQKRLRVMGWVFMTLALLTSLIGFFAYKRFTDQEGFYMVSCVFVLMGIYCLKPS